jgi:ABC-type sugar transport system substrate-binding protein
VAMKTTSIVGGCAALLAATFATFQPVSAADSVTAEWGTFTLAPRIASKIKDKQPANIIVSIMGTGVPLLSAQVRKGTDKACAANQGSLPLDCRIVGPVNPDSGQQLSELETILGSNQVDCLALQAPLPNQFTAVVNKFAAAGVPVFTFNIDAPKGKRLAFYALNEEAAGAINGKATATILKGKKVTVTEVAMGSGAPDEQWARERMKGFMAGFKSVMPDVKFFNDEKSGIPTGANFTTLEVLNTVTPFLTAHPEVNLFFDADQGVEGVGDVIRNLKLTGKVYTSGFNVSRAILDSISQGQTLVTIDQAFDNQAQAAVAQCAAFLKNGKVPSSPMQYLAPIVITRSGGSGQLDVEAARERVKQSR